MADATIARANWLSHEAVGTVGTWHAYIGAPGFPKKWLFEQDPNYEKLSEITVLFDQEGEISALSGLTKSGLKCSAAFTFDKTTKKHIFP